MLAASRAARKRLLWPRLRSDGQLEFALADVEELRAGRYGVPEPAPAAPTEPLGPDLLALVPGVAFDETGARLGRGGGSWDRALGEARGAAIFGVGYELQVIARVPREAHDRAVAALVTERGIRRFGTS